MQIPNASHISSTYNKVEDYFTVYDYWMPLFVNKWNREIWMGHRDSGKSIMSCQLNYDFLMEPNNKNASSLQCAQNYGVLRSYMTPPFERWVEIHNKEYGKGFMKFNRSTCEFTINYGYGDVRRLYTASFESGDSGVRSKHSDMVIIDEFSLLKRNLYYSAYVPLVKNNPNSRVLLIGTPKPETGTLFGELFERGLPENRKDDLDNLKKLIRKEITLNDLPPSFIDDVRWNSHRHRVSDIKDPMRKALYLIEKATMPPEIYDMEYECNYKLNLGLGYIYANALAKVAETNINDDICFDNKYPVYAAWDLGRSCLTCAWIFQIKENVAYFIDYYEGNNEHISAHINRVITRGYPILRHFLPVDSISIRQDVTMNTYNTFRSYGQQAETLPLASSVCLGAYHASHEIPRCKFNKTKCELGLEHLKKYKLKVDESSDTVMMVEDKASVKHHDAADAFRYAMCAINLFQNRNMAGFHSNKNYKVIM